MIFTKCLYNTPDPTDGLRVLITRYWPRWKTWKDLDVDLKVKELSPSNQLIKHFSNLLLEGGPSVDKEKLQDSFIDDFKDEIQEFHAQRWLKVLAKIANRMSVTLLCFEKEGEFCHRYIVHDLIVDKMMELETQTPGHIIDSVDINRVWNAIIKGVGYNYE